MVLHDMGLKEQSLFQFKPPKIFYKLIDTNAVKERLAQQLKTIKHALLFRYGTL